MSNNRSLETGSQTNYFCSCFQLSENSDTPHTYLVFKIAYFVVYEASYRQSSKVPLPIENAGGSALQGAFVERQARRIKNEDDSILYSDTK